MPSFAEDRRAPGLARGNGGSASHGFDAAGRLNALILHDLLAALEVRRSPVVITERALRRFDALVFAGMAAKRPKLFDEQAG